MNKLRNTFDLPNKWKVTHLLQAVPLYLFYFIFWCLPLDHASNFGGWIGRTIGPKLGASRKARRNLKLALPEIADQHNDIVIGMWDNLGRVMGEAPHTKKFHKGHRIEVIGLDQIKSLQATKTPIIIFSSHSSNWEIPPIGLWREGTPLSVVYRPPNNLFVDWLLRQARGAASPDLLPKGKDAARGIIKTLRAGGVIGWLLDQKESTGIETTFFGHAAMTSPAAADIALKMGAKLILSKTERIGAARFRITLLPALEIEGKDSATVTQMINDALEKNIRTNPDQWLWLHRRWPDTVYQKMEDKK